MPLGIEPVLETREIDEAAFKAKPAESNRIWIAGKPIEEWVNTSVGSSPCCSVCGDSECRTVDVGGATYEVVPEELLVKAGLIDCEVGLSGKAVALSSGNGRLPSFNVRPELEGVLTLLR